MNLLKRTKIEATEREILRLKQMKLEQLESELAQAKYQRDPALWLEERFKENPRSIDWSLWDPDRYAEHKWDGSISPLKGMWDALANGHWTALSSGVGTGKSHTLARIVMWYLDCFPNSLVVTSAPVQKQLELHLWTEIGRCFNKFKAIRPYAELYSLRLLVDGRRKGADSDNEGWQAVGFVAGIKAGEDSATKAQGFHRKHMLFILEECPGMPFPTMRAFTETAVASTNLICAVGNPDSAMDPLALFSRRARVKSFRASGYDHPNVVLKKEVIPGAVSVNSIEDRKSVYGAESSFFKSRTRGITPSQSSDSLIHYDWLLSCWKYSPDYAELPPIEIDPDSWNAVGVDVANSETGDKASLAWGKANILKSLQSFQCPNANHLAYNLIYSPMELVLKKYQLYGTFTITAMEVLPECIGVDSAGLGVATLNCLHDEGIKAVGLSGGQLDSQIPVDHEKKPLYKFGSLRAQMYYALREDLQNRRIILDFPDSTTFEKIAKQLTVVTFENTGGAIKVLSKEDVKSKLGGQSPDEADAVVYWNWMRRGPYRRNTIPLSLSSDF